MFRHYNNPLFTSPEAGEHFWIFMNWFISAAFPPMSSYTKNEEEHKNPPMAKVLLIIITTFQ